MPPCTSFDDAETAGHGVECGSGADDSATDDEDVEFLRLQGLDRGCAFLRAELVGTGD
jgi:hypothetical protein